MARCAVDRRTPTRKLPPTIRERRQSSPRTTPAARQSHPACSRFALVLATQQAAALLDEPLQRGERFAILFADRLDEERQDRLELARSLPEHGLERLASEP